MKIRISRNYAFGLLIFSALNAAATNEQICKKLFDDLPYRYEATLQAIRHNASEIGTSIHELTTGSTAKNVIIFAGAHGTGKSHLVKAIDKVFFPYFGIREETWWDVYQELELMLGRPKLAPVVIDEFHRLSPTEQDLFVKSIDVRTKTADSDFLRAPDLSHEIFILVVPIHYPGIDLKNSQAVRLLLEATGVSPLVVVRAGAIFTFPNQFRGAQDRRTQ